MTPVYAPDLSIREDNRLTIILSPINAAPGDINGDGRIDLKDAIWALKLLTGQAPALPQVRFFLF